MTLYQITQYIKYRWKAKGRHGTHSPFVYAFVQDVLHRSPNEAILLENIIRYFGFKKAGKLAVGNDGQIHYQSIPTPITPYMGELKNTERLNFNNLLLIEPALASDQSFFDQYLSDIQSEDALIIKDIYKTDKCRQQWDHLKKAPRVKLSMDLYSMGILFFRNEFKEQQDFVLK